MKRIYKPNYKGYLTLPRAFLYLLQNNYLTPTEFTYFLIFLSQADFDKRHGDLYTVILRDDEQIAKIINTHISTISRMKKKLIKKLILQKYKNGYIKVNLLPLFDKNNAHIFARLNSTQLQSLFAFQLENASHLQNKIAEMQFEDTEEKDITTTKKSKSMFSSKKDLGSSTKDIEEYIDPEDLPF